MLEHAALWIGSPDAVGVQALLDADARTPLGTARRAFTQTSWLPWSAPLVEVREQDDEPLLFTMRCRWGFTFRREVRDADERFVGRVLGGVIVDANGWRVATRRRAEGEAYSWVSPRGQTLAVVSPASNGLRLTFTQVIDGSPFVRMLLLAATLQP